MNYRGDYYSTSLGTSSTAEPAAGPGPTSGFLEPGTFTVSSPGGGPLPGGRLIGAFSAQIAVTAPPKFDNRFAVGSLQRGQCVAVNWSGVDAGALVEIRGVSAPNDPGTPVFCVEKGNAGQFTIPSNVLLSLPVGQFKCREWERVGLKRRCDRGGAVHRAGRGCRPASL